MQTCRSLRVRNGILFLRSIGFETPDINALKDMRRPLNNHSSIGMDFSDCIRSNSFRIELSLGVRLTDKDLISNLIVIVIPLSVLL